jgi:hypothetical protein
MEGNGMIDEVMPEENSRLRIIVAIFVLIIITFIFEIVAFPKVFLPRKAGEGTLIEKETVFYSVERVDSHNSSSYYFILTTEAGMRVWFGRSNIPYDEVMDLPGNKVDVIVDTDPEKKKNDCYKLVQLKLEGETLLSYEESLRYERDSIIVYGAALNAFYFIIVIPFIVRNWKSYKKKREEINKRMGFI